VQEQTTSVIVLIIGITVAVLVLVFGGVLSGSVYQIVEPDIDEIGKNAGSATFTVSNTTPVSLGNTYVWEGTLLINGTAASTNNFTVDYTAGTVQLKPNSEAGLTFSHGQAGTTAAFTWGQVAIREHVKSSIISGFQASEQTGKYMPLYVLGVMIFLILGLVVGLTMLGGGTYGGGRAL